MKQYRNSFYVSNFYEFIKGSHVDSYSRGSKEHSLVTLPLKFNDGVLHNFDLNTLSAKWTTWRKFNLAE